MVLWERCVYTAKKDVVTSQPYTKPANSPPPKKWPWCNRTNDQDVAISSSATLWPHFPWPYYLMYDHPSAANAQHGHIYGHKHYSYGTTTVVQPTHGKTRFRTSKPWLRKGQSVATKPCHIWPILDETSRTSVYNTATPVENYSLVSHLNNYVL
jgi:hypothetical protein